MADLTVLSLCSGIGGLERGVHAATGGRSRVVGYVEREAFAAQLLVDLQEKGALEPAPIWCGDLAELDPAPFLGVDLITCGFPCPAFSSAARGRNVGHDLWPTVARFVERCRPGMVFLENVQRRPIQWACADLESIGFRTTHDRFCSSEVGCPSPRVRWFALADIDGNSQLRLSLYAKMARVPASDDLGEWNKDPSRFLGMAHGIPPGTHGGTVNDERRGKEGSAKEVPEPGEVRTLRGHRVEAGEAPRGLQQADRRGDPVFSLPREGRPEMRVPSEETTPCLFRMWEAIRDQTQHEQDLLGRLLQDDIATERCETLARTFSARGLLVVWGRIREGAGTADDVLEIMREQARVVQSQRTDRLRALGNAVVPQQAALAYETLMRRIT